MKLPSELVGTAPLFALLLLAVIIAVRSPVQRESASRIVPVACLVLALQLIHFAEEYANEFHRRLPQFWGLEAWSDSFFLAFNFIWIAVWALSILALARGRTSLASLTTVWFLALAGCVNGVAHPALSLAAGEIFPGIFSSIPLGLAGLALCRALKAARSRGDRG